MRQRKIYLAARYARREEVLKYAYELEVRGHEITSTWVDGHHETAPGIDATAPGYVQAEWAAEDVEDVRRSEWVVSFTDGSDSRGGRHVEFGIALGLGKGLLLVGPREHVFHNLHYVAQFDTWELFLAWLIEHGE